jgi:hypothetical protein
MINERPQDKWLAPDTAAQMRTYSAQRMKGAWSRVTWSGILMLLFAGNLVRLLNDSHRDDTTIMFALVPAILLARFGYYVWRLIAAKRDVFEVKRSLGVVD